MGIEWSKALIGLFLMVSGMFAPAEPAKTVVTNTGQPEHVVDNPESLPESTPEVIKLKITVTGYSSSPDETDSDPHITASGKWVRDGIVATNLLPFGTKVRIPEEFGDKVFVVEDRMHSRFSNRIDVWFPSKNEARSFGKKNLEVEILPDELES